MLELVESLRGDAGRDANTNRFLKTCIIDSTGTTDGITFDADRRAFEGLPGITALDHRPG